MRGGVIGNENTDVGGYHIRLSFETEHKILDTILGVKSIWWAGMRAVSGHKQLKNCCKIKEGEI